MKIATSIQVGGEIYELDSMSITPTTLNVIFRGRDNKFNYLEVSGQGDCVVDLIDNSCAYRAIYKEIYSTGCMGMQGDGKELDASDSREGESDKNG